MEDILTERGQMPSDALTMNNSYCRLNPITCGPTATDVNTDFYNAAEADEWGSTNKLPWMII
jgi:hypothetical protein